MSAPINLVTDKPFQNPANIHRPGAEYNLLREERGERGTDGRTDGGREGRRTEVRFGDSSITSNFIIIRSYRSSAKEFLSLEDFIKDFCIHFLQLLSRMASRYRYIHHPYPGHASKNHTSYLGQITFNVPWFISIITKSAQNVST